MISLVTPFLTQEQIAIYYKTEIYGDLYLRENIVVNGEMIIELFKTVHQSIAARKNEKIAMLAFTAKYRVTPRNADFLMKESFDYEKWAYWNGEIQNLGNQLKEFYAAGYVVMPRVKPLIK